MTSPLRFLICLSIISLFMTLTLECLGFATLKTSLSTILVTHLIVKLIFLVLIPSWCIFNLLYLKNHVTTPCTERTSEEIIAQNKTICAKLKFIYFIFCDFALESNAFKTTENTTRL